MSEHDHEDFKRRLFEEEFGQYFKLASAKTPAGLCTECLAVRVISEVDPKEKCPASILRVGMRKAIDADGHKWKRFEDGQELAAYVKEHIGKYREIVDSAESAVRAISGA